MNSFLVQIFLQHKNMPLWIMLKGKQFLFLLIRVLIATHIPHKRQVESKYFILSYRYFSESFRVKLKILSIHVFP